MGKTVSLMYTVKLDDGTVIDSSEGREPLVFTLGDGDIIKGMEQAVKGMKIGEKKSFSVAPKDAYGEHDPNFVKELPRRLFPADMQIEIGSQLAATNTDGIEIPFCVTDMSDDNIVADFNHVLAGKTLNFDIEIVDISETVL